MKDFSSLNKLILTIWYMKLCQRKSTKNDLIDYKQINESLIN